MRLEAGQHGADVDVIEVGQRDAGRHRLADEVDRLPRTGVLPDLGHGGIHVELQPRLVRNAAVALEVELGIHWLAAQLVGEAHDAQPRGVLVEAPLERHVHPATACLGRLAQPLHQRAAVSGGHRAIERCSDVELDPELAERHRVAVLAMLQHPRHAA